MAEPVPIRPAEAPVDEAKVRIVEDVLARLKRGEQFTGLAILLANSKHYESPYDGYHFELLIAATRFAHLINMKMDERLIEIGD